MKLKISEISFCITVITFFFCCSSAEDVSPKKQISPILNDLAASETCPNVMCTKPPSGLNCNKTEVTNPNILNKLGTLKGCCSAFRCSEDDGSVSTYFGITGEEMSNDISSSSGSAPIDKCSLLLCPKPEEKDATCTISNAPDANDFKPKGDLQSCCPLYNCTVSADGTYHTRFALSAGKIPKEESLITKDKGTPIEDEKCPSIKCASSPVAHGCEATSQNFSSTLQTLGSYEECCPLWKCCFDDGTYFTHFEIATGTFWMTETSYFSDNKKGTTPVAVVASSSVKADDQPPDTRKNIGRTIGFQQASVPKSTPNKVVQEKKTITEDSREKENHEQQQSLSLTGLSSKLITGGKKQEGKGLTEILKIESESESEEVEEVEEVTSTYAKKKIIQQQQQKTGSGQQQKQQIPVLQHVVVNDVKERIVTSPKQILQLAVGDLKLAK